MLILAARVPAIQRHKKQHGHDHETQDDAEEKGIVKMFLIGGVVGLALGVGLTVLYFSLATFFEVNAKALDRKSEAVVERDKYTEVTSDKRKAG